MRKFTWSGAVAVMALVMAGVAVANEGESRSTKAVSATFSAEFGDHSVRTCQGADGRYRRLSGVWEGEAQSADAALDGELRLKGTAYIHVPSGNGAFEGHLRVGGEHGLQATLHAVLKEGKLEGFALGHSGKRGARFLANVSATLTADGIADGKLGGGGGANTAVLVKGACPKASDHGKKDEAKREGEKKESEKAERKHREFAGTVAAVTREWLTLSVGHETVKCEVPAAMAAEVLATVSVGAKVVALCSYDGEHWHLVKVRKHEEDSKSAAKVRDLQGEISAFGAGSITVSAAGREPLTCSVGERMAAELTAAGYAVGTKVMAVCVYEGKGFALTKIKKV